MRRAGRPAWALVGGKRVLRSNYAATEREIIRECARMRAEGLHGYDLGTSSNLRNRIQRSCDYFKIYRETHEKEGYDSIFVRIPGPPVRYGLVLGYEP